MPRHHHDRRLQTSIDRLLEDFSREQVRAALVASKAPRRGRGSTTAIRMEQAFILVERERRRLKDAGKSGYQLSVRKICRDLARRNAQRRGGFFWNVSFVLNEEYMRALYRDAARRATRDPDFASRLRDRLPS